MGDLQRLFPEPAFGALRILFDTAGVVEDSSWRGAAGRTAARRAGAAVLGSPHAAKAIQA